MYKNYVFDLYGTLVDIHTDESRPSFWDTLAWFFSKNGAFYSPFELKSEYFYEVKKEKESVSKQFPEFIYIDINLINVFDRLYLKRNVKADQHTLYHTASKFREYSTDYIRLYDGAKDLLLTLQSKNKNIYLLSNAQKSFTVPELKKLGIFDLFDGILISSDIKCSKPDKHFFETLFNIFNLEKKESIMIGNDWKSDIQGAFNFGIDSLYIHQKISPPLDIKQLKSNFSILDGNVYTIKELLIK